MKKLVLIVIAVAIILIPTSAIIGYKWYNDTLASPASESTEKVQFVIAEGESLETVIQRLEQDGLITNAQIFQFYLKFNHLENTIQAGTFEIPRNLNMIELSETLQHGTIPDVWVTIPEGKRHDEIAEILAQEFSVIGTKFSKEEYLNFVDNPSLSDRISQHPILADKPAENNLEGFLFPDTYRFSPDATAEDVIMLQLDTLQSRLDSQLLDDIVSSKYTLYETINLASIIEREARKAEDYPIVADIMLRRMDIGMALEVDATLLYYFGDWQHQISHEELSIDTPYNTRLYRGLPPTPISNPGIATIEGVVYPSPNEYWFYVSDANGNMHYAKTLAEHEQNIIEWIEPTQ